uniref:(northern house mosquito) hypothetical protein n=1 Tax=Culex pipiens TaxID=7175 RepID=A0A8D8JWR4_CULPI
MCRPNRFSGWHRFLGLPQRPLNLSHLGLREVRPLESPSWMTSTLRHVVHGVPNPLTSYSLGTRTYLCLPGAVHKPCEPSAANNTGWLPEVMTVLGNVGRCSIPLRVS